MSECSRDTIQKTMQRLREAEDSHTFGEEVKKLRELLKQMGMPVEVLLELE